MGSISSDFNTREYNKFVQVGTGSAISTLGVVPAVRTLLYGKTSTGTGLPILVKDDGSGHGKIALSTV